MKKIKAPVRFTGQHFTIDKILIADAIKFARIRKKDVVIDIGAGKGFLTIHLVKYCREIIAIENDENLVSYLLGQFKYTTKVKVVGCDFRRYTLPDSAFKVVANIPYGITSDILKSLMFKNVHHFGGGALIMQQEAAQKLTSAKVFNPFVVFYRTFFEIKAMYEISPGSFMPPPGVNSVLVHIARKESNRVRVEFKEKYLDFLFYVLQKPELTALTVLKKLFRKRQVRSISAKYCINLDHQVAHLSPLQWSVCFLEMLSVVPEKYHPTSQM
jgi:23S rRNA (adenine-N6)-dimethyltransferase